MQQTMLTTRDVARMFNVDVRSVHRMVQTGRLDAMRVPGYKGPLLFDPTEVAKLKQKRASK